ncbi:helix-turn-helix domain-containing protein [Chitinophaga sp. sic0106]|uniref:helix-turn-helix domain-containing protein n=1 Tax=Chitinophaga sp. sic0106 TaxID=2854785 RepID=UPI001C451E1E|nr:helix-turn-helix transcriptional regulator [Chitinophaga sp. sic0106]MBV7532998.1 helix-turn-helix domain-containing protein [Chitinophaga sp. sic0106]
MITFGKKLRECREAKGFSQQELAKQLGSAHTVIGRYERDEMTPSIEVAKKLAKILDTTVGYLLGEATHSDTFKDPAMLQRLNEINSLPEEDKRCIIYTIDSLLQNARTKKAFTNK